MIAEIFSWGINNCFFIQSDLGCSSCWNSTSWAESLILGLMVGNKPRKIFFWALIHTLSPLGHNVSGGQLFAPKLKFGLIQ